MIVAVQQRWRIRANRSVLKSFLTERERQTWEHFGFKKDPDKPLDKTRVGCKLCRMVLKYCGNTTNLTDHVRRKHATYLQQPSTDSTLAESTKSDMMVLNITYTLATTVE